MLSCIAIDDEPLALRVIAAFAQQHAHLALQGSFVNPLEAKTFLEKNPVDLLFLDIDMLEINGLDFAKTLVPAPMLIFTTAHKEFALEGFELDSVDYLLKPFDYERFDRAIDKAQLRQRAQQGYRPFMLIYTEYQRTKVYFDEIECLESMQDYVKIHLLQGKTILTLATLKSMVDRLPASQFLRIHRSYIVSVNHILSFSQKKIKLPHFLLNVGDNYYKDVLRTLADSSTQ